MTFGHEGGHTDRPRCGKCGKVMTRENARLRPELFLHDACLPDGLKPAAVPVDAVPAPTADDLALDVRGEYDTVQFAETHGDRLGNSAAYLRRLAAAEADRDRLRDALVAASLELTEHDMDYQHATRPAVLKQIDAALAAADPNRRA